MPYGHLICEFHEPLDRDSHFAENLVTSVAEVDACLKASSDDMPNCSGGHVRHGTRPTCLEDHDIVETISITFNEIGLCNANGEIVGRMSGEVKLYPSNQQ